MKESIQQEKKKRGRKKKTEESESKKKEKPSSKKFFFAKGRRKEALAQIKLFLQEGKGMTVNGRNIDLYFTSFNKIKALSPLKTLNLPERFDFEARIKGGGNSSQAEALKLALARALVKCNPIWRKKLKKEGFLSQDIRIKERKKYGLKKARRAPQWSKR